MRKLHEKGFPVPKPLYLSTDEDDEYFDTVFFIREYVEVCAMDNCIKPLLYIIRMYSNSDKNNYYLLYVPLLLISYAYMLSSTCNFANLTA